MHDHTAPTPDAPVNPRRAFLVRVIQGVHATIGATLAFILGSAVLAPSLARRERLWLSAGDASALKDGEPLAVTLRVARQDGASEVVDRRVVFLVKSGEQVRASTRRARTSAAARASMRNSARSSAPATAASTTSPARSCPVRRRTRSSSCRRASMAVECWCRCRP